MGIKKDTREERESNSQLLFGYVKFVLCPF